MIAVSTNIVVTTARPWYIVLFWLCLAAGALIFLVATAIATVIETRGDSRRRDAQLALDQKRVDLEQQRIELRRAEAES